MDYHLSEHAQDALRKRRIPEEWVARVLRDPDRTEDDLLDSTLEHRLAPIPEAANRVLRVIVNRTVDPPRVVTAYFDRRRRRG